MVKRDIGKGKVSKHAALLASAAILAAAIFLCALYIGKRGYGVTVNLEDYTTVGRNALGVPVAAIDIDALLTDLHLPNPKSPFVNMADYPDVYALCSMSVSLSYTSHEELMHVEVSCDLDTLTRYGIRIANTGWEQSVRGLLDDGATATPVPLAESTVLPAPTGTPAAQDGLLTALVDEQGRGYNLRSVCERVQKERDSVCVELFGNNYNAEKTQLYFIVSHGGSEFTNLYRAVYVVTEVREDETEPRTECFTVDILNLYMRDGVVFFRSVDVNIVDNESEADAISRFNGPDYDVTRLHGGVVTDREAYDQNGFVRFIGCPTSYRMANGIYWSATYEPLTEDMVWSLTAVPGHSLANLLRYARKEIYARYYCIFDERTEHEFLEHYSSYDWYEGREDDLSELMSDMERANIALLREIQDLIEH